MKNYKKKVNNITELGIPTAFDPNSLVIAALCAVVGSIILFAYAVWITFFS